ncbi:MAG: O-antigen ligase family protein [Pirellulales bacterium]|nr:O-antigen ligase family protein [Pirellulales bacterium]
MSMAAEMGRTPWQGQAAARDFAKGLWPQSTVMWLIFGWFALYIIRPWEVLMPWLTALRIERTYCATVLLTLICTGALKFDLSRQSVALYLLLGAMVVSAFTGIAYYLSMQGIYDVLVHVAMYIAMVSVIRKPRDLLCIATMYVVIMAMYLGKSQWEYFVYGRHEYTQGVPRLIGIDLTYCHYNSVAASALLTMPMLQLLWSSRQLIGQSYSATARKRLKLLLMGYGFLAVSSVLLTNSRGGMLGLLIFAVLACVTGKSAMRALKTLGLMAAVGIPTVMLALPETQMERLSTLWDGTKNQSAESSLELRKLAVQDGLRIFAENPITGVGLNNFKRYRAQRQDSSTLEAHNVFVQILGEMGILGGAAFAMFIVCTWNNFRKIRRLAAYSGDAEAEFLEKLALAGRNSLLLLMYFGLLGSNLDRFNWFWLAGVGVAGLAMAKRSVRNAADEDLDDNVAEDEDRQSPWSHSKGASPGHRRRFDG